MTPTRTVNLWLANDEGLYYAARGMADAAEGDAGRLAVALQAWITEELAPDLGASMFSDLLTHALADVDWQEIADDLLETGVK